MHVRIGRTFFGWFTLDKCNFNARSNSFYSRDSTFWEHIESTKGPVEQERSGERKKRGYTSGEH